MFPTTFPIFSSIKLLIKIFWKLNNFLKNLLSFDHIIVLWKKPLDEIIGNTSGAVSNVTETVLDHAEKFGPAGGADDIPIEQPVSTDEKSDDAMSYFKKLAEQDWLYYK